MLVWRVCPVRLASTCVYNAKDIANQVLHRSIILEDSYPTPSGPSSRVKQAYVVEYPLPWFVVD